MRFRSLSLFLACLPLAALGQQKVPPPPSFPAAPAHHPEAAPPRLTGIVNLPDFKCALLEAPAEAWRDPSMTLAEKQRDGEVEVLSIHSEQGSVELLNGGKPVTLRLGSGTNSITLSGTGLIFEQANLRPVLRLYGQFTKRSILKWSRLPTTTLTLKTSAASAAEAAKAIEKALADQGVVSIPDGEKFMMVVPKAQTAKAKPGSSQLKAAAAGSEEFARVGFVDFRAVDPVQATMIFADLMDRRPDRDDPLRNMDREPVWFYNQTPLTKAEVIYAFETLFRWRGYKVVSSGTDLVHVERLTD